MDLAAVSQSFMNAALDPSLWDQAMEDAGRYGNGVGAVLLPVRGRMPSIPASAVFRDGLQTYFRDGWHLRDERERGLPTMRTRGIFVDQDFASPEETSTSDYFRGLLAPYDVNWGAGIGVNVGNEEWCLMVARGDRAGPFKTSEQKKLLQLAAPLNQAALLAHSLSYGRAVGLSEAFDLIGCASLLVDRFGKVFRWNREAESYLSERLSLAQGELSCARRDETTELRKMIHALCFREVEDLATTVRSVVITGKTGHPIIVQGIMLRGTAGEVFGPTRALLLIVDPFRDRAPAPTDDIRRVFGLSKAEAALLALLDRDLALPQAAERLGISYETARTQLKSIFQRTDTRRQSEVLRLLQRLTLRLQP